MNLLVSLRVSLGSKEIHSEFVRPSRLRHVALLRHAQSNFGVLSVMTDDLASALKRAGIRVSMIDAVELSSMTEMVEKLAPDCTWAVNISLSEYPLFYPLGIPHVNLSVDPLVYCTPNAFERSHSVWLFVDSHSHELFRSRGGKRSHWFPHAIGQETLDRALSEELIPLENRSYDICLPGSYLVDADEGIHGDLLDIVQKALADLSFPFFEQLFSIAEQRGLDPFAVGMALANLLRGLDRNRLLQTLSGRVINIFTSPLDAVEWGRKETAKSCIFHPPVDFRSLFDLCRSSKVVLNSAPHIRLGYHERLFLTLASGAIAVTERGRLPQWLVDGGRVVEYDTDSLATVSDRLREAEKKPYDRESVLKWLSMEHTWDARLRKLLPEIERDVFEIKKEWKNEARCLDKE